MSSQSSVAVVVAGDFVNRGVTVVEAAVVVNDVNAVSVEISPLLVRTSSHSGMVSAVSVLFEAAVTIWPTPDAVVRLHSVSDMMIRS